MDNLPDWPGWTISPGKNVPPFDPKFGYVGGRVNSLLEATKHLSHLLRRTVVDLGVSFDGLAGKWSLKFDDGSVLHLPFGEEHAERVCDLCNGPIVGVGSTYHANTKNICQKCMDVLHNAIRFSLVETQDKEFDEIYNLYMLTDDTSDSAT